MIIADRYIKVQLAYLLNCIQSFSNSVSKWKDGFVLSFLVLITHFLVGKWIPRLSIFKIRNWLVKPIKKMQAEII